MGNNLQRQLLCHQDRAAFEKRAKEEMEAAIAGNKKHTTTFFNRLHEIEASRPTYTLNPELVAPCLDQHLKSRATLKASMEKAQQVTKFADDPTIAARYGKMTMTITDSNDQDHQHPVKPFMEAKLADFEERKPYVISQLQNINMEPNTT